MALQLEIDDAWKAAVKARSADKDALSLIRGELKNRAIEVRGAGAQGTALPDDAALEVLTKMAKQRRESIAEYEKGGRADLVEKEMAELRVVERFLPAQLSEAELQKLVDAAVESCGATSVKEMGKVMGVLMPQVKGRADGGVLQRLVKARLG